MVSAGDSGETSKGGTKTNRLSVANPPLQQIAHVQILREIFTAPPGYLLAELDYKGAEVAVCAWLSDCKLLREWLIAGVDQYVEMGHAIWDLPREQIVDDVRDDAKTGFLARMFGQGVNSFAARTGAPIEKVQKFFDWFDKNLWEIRRMHKRLVHKANKGEVITNPWDSPRKFDLEGRDTINALYNDPVQSTSSEILLWKAIGTEKLHDPKDFKTVMLTHDSLTAEVLIEKAKEILAKQMGYMVKDDFPFKFRLTVPLKVTCKVGVSLGDVHKWKPGEAWRVKFQEVLDEPKGVIYL
jgi:DNA polymerase I-like protein with 3'-5' exonuclease and polymerase domains